MLIIPITVLIFTTGFVESLVPFDPFGHCRDFCNYYDGEGIGYLPLQLPNPGCPAAVPDCQCWSYRVCWKVDFEIRDTTIAHCPVGTIFDYEEAIHGNPCRQIDQLPAGCEPRRPQTTKEQSRVCPFTRGADGHSILRDFINHITKAVEKRKVGDCGIGGEFDATDGICTCIKKTNHCKCKIYIPLHLDIYDHGCHGGHVRGMSYEHVTNELVNYFVDINCTHAGNFSGFHPWLHQGSFLQSMVLNGAYHNWCLKQLSVSAIFMYTGDNTGTKAIVSYSDCVTGFGVMIYIEAGVSLRAIMRTKPNAGYNGPIGTHTEVLISPIAVTPGVWYFVSLVLTGHRLYLFHYPLSVYKTCCIDGLFCPQAVASANIHGCVRSTNCGFNIGFNSGEQNPQPEDFFVGYISKVQWFEGTHLCGCPHRFADRPGETSIPVPPPTTPAPG